MSDLVRNPKDQFSSVVLTKFNTVRKHTHAIYRDFFQLYKMKISLEKVLYFSYFCSKHNDCGYTIEPLRRGSFNEYPQSMFWSKNKKNRYTPHSPVLLYKSGVQEGTYYTEMFS